MLDGIFITGTDTGVGKTYVGSRIVAGLKAHGIAVTARKPVESGCERDGDRLLPADAMAYAEALGDPSALERICPFRFEAALAPPSAARRAGVRLRMQDLVTACDHNNGLLVVEGAGGFYSPLAEDGLNADLASTLGLPVLLVAANRLGCINHVLLTLEAVGRRGLTPLGIVLTTPRPEMALADNPTALRQWQPLPVVTLEHDAPLDTSALFSLLGHPLERLDHRIG